MTYLIVRNSHEFRGSRLADPESLSQDQKAAGHEGHGSRSHAPPSGRGEWVMWHPQQVLPLPKRTPGRFPCPEPDRRVAPLDNTVVLRAVLDGLRGLEGGAAR